LGAVFLLKLPPTGTVASATLSVSAGEEASVTVDVGADGGFEGRFARDPATVDWTEAINRYLARREQSGEGQARDDNNWRIVPIRVSAAKPATVTVNAVAIQVR
jgi:hypothetical protein